MKRVAIYLRVSTSKQDTANQLRELKTVAKRSGWKIVATYEDAGISGAKGRDQRPGLDAMLKAVNAKEFDLVAAWSVDRLGRSLTDRVAVRRAKTGRARGQRRRDLFLGAGAILALMLGLTVWRHPSEARTGNGDVSAKEKVKEDSLRRVDSLRVADSLSRVDSLRRDSIAKAASFVPVAVEITKWEDSVRAGEYNTFEAVARDADDRTQTDSLRWRSSNARIASVDSLTGRLHAKSGGAVTIYAKAGAFEDHVTIRVSGGAQTKTPPGVNGDSQPRSTPGTATTRKVADLVEDAFDQTIRAAILRGDINAIHDYLRPEFEKELRDSIRTVQGGKLFVRRRDFIVDTLKGRVSFWLQIDVAVGTKPRHALIQYREMSASLDRRVRGLLPLAIGIGLPQ
jgi:hypothetical protein